jgi:peptidoglycan/xylan/chitin deacetylase (PgdA/CDA1 family)
MPNTTQRQCPSALAVLALWVAAAASCSNDPQVRFDGGDGADVVAPGRDVASGTDADPPRPIDGAADATGTIPPPSRSVADPNLRVQAWNGRAGAVSFTFDDAYGSHLDAVLPALNARGIPGTFFVVCSQAMGRQAEWRAVAMSGVHEIANHTMTHRAASDNVPGEITDCDAYIRTSLGFTPYTFAYPLTNVGDPYASYSSSHYVAARGGGDVIVHAGDAVNWTNLPSYYTGPGGGVGTPLNGITAAISRAESERGWAILTAHSVETDDFYARISRADLEAMLDHARARDLWIAPFGAVASYLRTQQLLTAATPTRTTSRWTWRWTAPPGLPPRTMLRVVIDGGTLTQRGAPVVWNGVAGYYPVEANAGELTWAM